MKPWLILDVDDVCYDFVKSLYKVAKENNKLREPSLSYKEWQTYNHLDLIDFDNQEEFRKFMVEKNVLSQHYAIEGAKDFLDWAKNNFSIALITARGFHPEAEEVTKEFFKSILNINPDKVIISGLYGDSKVHHVEKFIKDGIVGFVDDSMSHVRDFQDAGVNSYLMAQNWNKENTFNSKRVSSLNEVKEMILMSKIKSNKLN